MKISPYLTSHKSPHSSRGFTIVETLVAITILMIAIAGPLVVASKGLNSALYAKDQMTATFLAQETMEVLKNAKDNYVAAKYSFPDFIPSCVGTSMRCALLVNGNTSSDVSLPSSSCPAEGCPIYVSESGYNHTQASGASLTAFSRYFYLEDKGDAAHQLTATVVVTWHERTIPYEIRLSSVIANTSK